MDCSFKNEPPPGGLEPPTFRLTAERANQLRHGGLKVLLQNMNLRTEPKLPALGLFYTHFSKQIYTR